MNDKQFEELKYHSGLVADGSWNELDSYDQEAIRRFGDLIIRDCIDTCERLANAHWADVENPTAQDAADEIKERFGIE